MKYSENVDIVWFELYKFYDGTKKPKEIGININEIFKENLSGLINTKDILDVIDKFDIIFFSAFCRLFTRFKIIKDNNVRFINGIIYEDLYFSILVVLALSNTIYKINDILYYYRIRPKSTVTNTNNELYGSTFGNVSAHQRKIYDKFQCDDKKAKMYYYASMVINGIATIKLTQTMKDNKSKEIILKKLTPMHINHIKLYLESKIDPFNIMREIDIAKPYLKYFNLSTKLAISYPKAFRFFYPLFKMARYIKRKIKKDS